MSDHYQIMSIVAGAIRSCRSEMTGDHRTADIATEELNCIAKAILGALADSGLQIVAIPKVKGESIVDDEMTA